MTLNNTTTIAAIATPPGMGAIAVIRLSGSKAIEITDKLFRPVKKKKSLLEQAPYTIHYGSIMDGNREVDQVLVSLFKAPHSYTGEDVVEISCHGSVVIQQQLLELFVRNGAQLAQPGEFTLRAFMNGKIDLSQAEAIADLIASTNETARRVALNQMRGGISNKLAELRNELLKFTALVELELDFSEEDVEFADRTELTNLISTIIAEIDKLSATFSQGNAIKSGIPVTIAGKPNVGKSTLLNRLLNEEKAIVSEIAGTTRDTIEDTIHLGGINFRFIDTAGIRHTTDTIESIGIERAYNKIEKARIVLYLTDALCTANEVIEELNEFTKRITSSQKLIVLVNKEDKSTQNHVDELTSVLNQKGYNALAISAKAGHNIDALQQMLIDLGKIDIPENVDVIVTNVRHYNALIQARESLTQVIDGLKANISGDLLAVDIYQALDYLGEITGEISNDEVLGYIFSKFCIGK
ncbi:tRNA uridine-5-carboxymethylaminomethyl(34) synthesis GTPase MnmE [Tenuifilum thalassicum]|uniref:tRNA modification GTPase MnmE n=1 Tax=Tenuifilum thalassicum TaxID=2590900 RepID=A0A7D3XEM1_9BACT|nr:tRNA uridine-5-carboxymethylaminomethyl(34) synthesis GTPase MnmE [Tenuifilum thalassicum]QKG80067.1 tRNA uridine-5-carboxymethylaminomethyl(34) synthesis GTPase MnmE [Tenuifilum thalassicum]